MNWSRLVALLLVAAPCSVGCAAPSPPNALLPRADVDPDPPGVNPADPRSREDLRAERRVATVLAQVSALRSLAVGGPVRAKVIDRTQMLEQVKRQVRAQVPPDAIRGESDFLVAFGFVPADYDYEAEVYRLIQSQIAGYYDPDAKIMFLMADLSDEEADVTLAHELVHALQDQHYDLGPKLDFRPDGNDLQSAIHCLAEGDATSLMLDYTLRHQEQDALAVSDERLRLEIVTSMAVSPELASFPRVLRDSLVAPYVDGILFVHALRRRGGWAAVDAVWRNPPQTTEQVLHLDKLDAREPSEPLSVPSVASLGAGWRVTHTDVLGEQGVRVALEEWMPRQVAVLSAAGWSGDRAVVWTKVDGDSTQIAAAWHIRFDRGARGAALDHEATEAFDNITSAWDLTSKARAACRLSPLGRAIGIAQRGRNLALVATPPQPVGMRTQPDFDCALARQWAADIASAP